MLQPTELPDPAAHHIFQAHLSEMLFSQQGFEVSYMTSHIHAQIVSLCVRVSTLETNSSTRQNQIALDIFTSD